MQQNKTIPVVITKFQDLQVASDFSLLPKTTVELYNRRFCIALDISSCLNWLHLHSSLIHKTFEILYNKKITIIPPSFDSITTLVADFLSCATSELPQIVPRAVSQAIDVVNLQTDWLNSRIEDPSCQVDHQPSPQIREALTRANELMWIGFTLDKWMMKLQEQLRSRTPCDEVPSHKSIGPFEFYLLGRFVVINVQNQYTLFPAVVLSLLVSKSIELGACFMAISQQRRSDLQHFYSIFKRFLRAIHSALSIYKNKGHILLKALDGIGHGILTHRLDSSHSTFLLDNVMKDLRQEFRFPDIQRFVSLLYECAPWDITELTGLSKVYGYPTIDTLKGMNKLYDRTHKDINITTAAVNRVIDMAKLLFLDAYFKRHNQYPKVLMSSRTPKGLVKALLSNESFTSPSFDVKYGRITPRDFTGITLTQCVPFDWFDRFYPLLKDKACAPKKNLLKSAITSEADRIPPSKRVLLEYLRNPFVSKDWKRFRQQFSSKSNAVDDEFVIKLTSKEKEQKPEGRMFGQSPMNERHRRVVGEANIALLMEEYNNDQCMLLNDSDKKRKMAFLSRASAYTTTHHSLIIGVDAEAWNNYFRATLVDTFGGEFFDRIFGIDFYSQTMRVFNKGLIYHRDAADRLILWEGQEGGIEGLAQKVWTWIYTVIARLVLYLLNLEGYMMVNGDDMRIIVLIPKNKVSSAEELNKLQRDLMGQLQILFETYGIIMKTEETNMTHELLCFGKNYVVNGINLPGSMKKIIKATGLTDVGIPSLTDIIASIFSNAHSACSVSYQITPHVVFAYSMTLIYLHWFGYISLIPTPQKPKFDFTLPQVVILLTTPNVMGGLDILLLPQFIVQGESDPIPLAIDWFTYLWHAQPEFRGVIERVLSIRISPIIPRNLLLTDVYSLPIERPSRPLHILSRRVRKAVHRMTRNVELRKLLDFDAQERRRLVDAIFSMKPFNVRIGSFLYSITICAVVDSIIQKFEASPTIASLLFTKDRHRMFSLATLIYQSDDRSISSVMRRIVTPTLRDETKTLQYLLPMIQRKVCATTQATELRKHSWKRPDLVDCTLPSSIQQIMITTENKMDPSMRTFYPTSAYIDHYTAQRFQLEMHGEFRGPLSDLVCAPFFAHTTGLRLGARFKDLKGNEPFIQMVKRLTDAQALLADCGGDLVSWVDMCSLSVFNERIQEFCPTVTSKLGGTTAHRLPSRGFDRTVNLNVLPSRTGRVKVNLDSLGERNKLCSKNRTHNYSAISCWIRYITTCDIENDLLSSGVTQTVWGVMVNCRDISGDTSLCTCHQIIEVHDYTVDIPPHHVAARLERLVQSCDLLRMSNETSEMISLYRQQFKATWVDRYELSDWITDGISEDKYNTASLTACTIIADLLEPYGTTHGFTKTDSDSIQFQQTLGRFGKFSQLSARDLLLFQYRDLASAVLYRAVSMVIDEVVNMQIMQYKDLEAILNRSVFLPLINQLFIMKGQGPFAVQLNQLMYISLNYETLINQYTFAKSMSRVIRDFIYNAFQTGAYIPRTILIYLPAIETDQARRRMILGQIWRFHTLAHLQLKYRLIGTTDSTVIPKKYTNLADLSMHSPEYLAGYFARCALMTAAFNTIGEPCPSEFRELRIRPTDWGNLQSTEFLTWDPEYPTFDISTLQQDQVEAIKHQIILLRSRTFLSTVALRLMFTRVNLESCIKVCKSYIEETTQSIEQPETIRAVPCKTQDTRFITTQARPIDAELPLSRMIRPMIPPAAPNRSERCAFSPSCLYRSFTLSTTALNKYLEIILSLKNYRSFTKNTGLIFCGADGSGGVTVLCARIFKNCRVIFNTLQSDPMKTTLLIDCPDVAHLNTEECNRVIAAHNITGSNDLSDERVIKRYIHLTEQDDYGRFLLITCDAEVNTPEIDSNLIRNMILLINEGLSDGGMAIIKRFISIENHNVTLAMFMASVFARFGIIKPLSSHNTSGEVFYVGVGKTRSLPREEVTRFLQSPTYTFECERYFKVTLESLCSQRQGHLMMADREWDTSLQELTPALFWDKRFVKELLPWNITFNIIHDNCTHIPTDWYHDHQLRVKEFQCKALIQTCYMNLSGEVSLSAYMSRSYAASLGSLIVFNGYIKGYNLRAIENKRRKTMSRLKSEMQQNGITAQECEQRLRRIVYGGRITLSFIGLYNSGFFYLQTDD
nr:TPA_asm: hypothetical protein [Pseudoglobulus fluke virus]